LKLLCDENNCALEMLSNAQAGRIAL